MKIAALFCLLTFFAMCCSCRYKTSVEFGSVTDSEQIGEWSETQNGLKARLKISYHLNAETVVAGLKLELLNSTANIAPVDIFLEPEDVIAKVYDVENQMEVNVPSFQIRSGPNPKWGKLVIPKESSISLSLRCETITQPSTRGLFIGLCNDDWLIDDLSKQFLVCVSIDIEEDRGQELWYGRLKTPFVQLKTHGF